MANHFSHGSSGSKNYLHEVARSFALLSGLSLPALSTLFTNANPAHAIELQEKDNKNGATVLPNTKEERGQLKESIQNTLRSLKSTDSKSILKQNKLGEDLKAYCRSIENAEDLTLQEISSISDFAICTLNMLDVRNSLPEQTCHQFIGTDILRLHCVLIDRLQDKDNKLNLSKYEIEYKVIKLLDDLIWSENYNSPELLEVACDLFAERVFRDEADILGDRYEYLKVKILECPEIKSSCKLSELALNYSYDLLKDNSNDQGKTTSLLRIYGVITPPNEVVPKFRALINDFATREAPNELIFYTIGLSFGESFIDCANRELLICAASNTETDPDISSLTSIKILKSLAQERTNQLSRQETEPAIQLLTWDILNHAIYGTGQQNLINIPNQPATWGDGEKLRALRTNCVSLSLGILTGIDQKIIPDNINFDDIKLTEEALKDRSKSSADKCRIEHIDNKWRKEIFQCREALRDRFENFLFYSITDEDRAKILVQLMLSDQRCFNSLVKSEQYQNSRLERLSNYFSEAKAGDKQGRYSTRIGGIYYVPAALVEEDPIPYADLYFYIREILTTNKYGKSWLDLKTHDEELNKLALDYARARQTIFICEFAKIIWGDKAELRPFEKDRSNPDARMHKEILPLLNKFGAFRDNLDIIFVSEINNPSTFKEAIEKIQIEARVKRDQFHERIIKKIK